MIDPKVLKKFVDELQEQYKLSKQTIESEYIKLHKIGETLDDLGTLIEYGHEFTVVLEEVLQHLEDGLDELSNGIDQISGVA